MSHTEHPVFGGFITLWVFNPKRRTEITHSELLVYSALAHADCRHQILTNVDLPWKTGLDRNTVASVIISLGEKKLVADRTPLERTDLFWTTKKANAEHWSQRLRFWKCLIRCEGSKLKVSDQSVLSYVWWSKITGFDPPKGWSERYVASIIKLKSETVEAAISRLEKMCLLKRDGQRWLVPKYLTAMQEGWLIRKATDQTEKVTLGEFEPDMRELGNRYAPGEIIFDTNQAMSVSEVASDPVVEAIKVIEYLNPLLRDHELGDVARHRIVQSARRDLERVGTNGHEWRSIVDNHLQRYLDQQQKTLTPASSGVVEDEEFLREMCAYES